MALQDLKTVWCAPISGEGKSVGAGGAWFPWTTSNWPQDRKTAPPSQRTLATSSLDIFNFFGDIFSGWPLALVLGDVTHQGGAFAIEPNSHASNNDDPLSTSW
ncbi:hypothetical protein PLICRDRAFT_175695 [Plicaturopsis crispa FD-325 SS-3]|nr:hypothetical protein PLICRDRAFT_175695 [Plicaturopsis crispa FD-325 SS-3]